MKKKELQKKAEAQNYLFEFFGEEQVKTIVYKYNKHLENTRKRVKKYRLKKRADNNQQKES